MLRLSQRAAVSLSSCTLSGGACSSAFLRPSLCNVAALRFFSEGARTGGRVKWFDQQKGFGFISTDAGEDLFVHQSAIKSTGFRALSEGAEVEFDIDVGQDGKKKCLNVTQPGGADIEPPPRRAF
eukprot:NODE_8243_length_526_cov_7.656184_g7187_i0.p2 GENE.NODE_8243_length_526_cov_7.656184_g7187_i0~~NODE_8243_length_526_cov_7.656184_g7187_i0.p2  ORF type:complete len:125 (-),score=29.31 NODE_8243_length_526_cov_7.656184_g7187_i0:108-482(-)